MRRAAKVFIVIAAFVVALLLLGPREPAGGEITFAASQVGADVDGYLAAREAVFGDIVEGAEKRVIWAGAPGARTPLSIVYLHGFSATSEEIRPVPDNVAAALGANLYYARLAGHGRGGDALAEATVADWLNDYAEAVEIGARLGERVLVLATSTGATVAMQGHFEDEIDDDAVAGFAMVSPNFGLANPLGGLLTLPFARQWVPVVAGEERSFATKNEAHARYWTATYPTVAVLPMAASVQATVQLAYEDADVPALFVFSDADQVVDAARTRAVAADWGAAVTIVNPEPGEGDDPFAHVIAGDIMSPGLTDEVTAAVVQWAGGL
ncbi:alpha/beta hydrolase [Pontivivens ytuae]|uniref:Alpha/beta hydrolase n=1 Tax=Pontivivens ytuae TaxID=2789856 RepID=A0A7S9QDZ3_9RHOB|nr:alpha/beta fold hydrolase [Pontivivens ytuae]QPH54681.1 alpha/beta hydrolase [Pontivivens ytuae]